MSYYCRFCMQRFAVERFRESHERQHVRDDDTVLDLFVGCDCDAAITKTIRPDEIPGSIVSLTCSQCSEPVGNEPVATTGGAA